MLLLLLLLLALLLVVCYAGAALLVLLCWCCWCWCCLLCVLLLVSACACAVLVLSAVSERTAAHVYRLDTHRRAKGRGCVHGSEAGFRARAAHAAEQADVRAGPKQEQARCVVRDTLAGRGK